MISLQPKLLRRYYDIARLLARYGRGVLGDDGLAELAEEGVDTKEQSEDGEALARDLEALGPTFVKLGQVLSTRPDLIPPAYVGALARLQNDVDPFAFEEASDILTEELGVRPSKAFRELDPKPLAAASMAQVHRAVLRDGREVVVKIQRPGIRRRMADDLEALGELAELLERHSEAARRRRVVGVVEEFRRALKSELDFRNEVANLETFRSNLADFPRLVVPRPIPDFCSSKVVTMEFVAGTQISDLNPVVRTELAGKALADELFRAYLHQVLVDGFFHADPHPGNILLTREHDLVILDLGMVGRFQPKLQTQLIKLLIAISESEAGAAADVALEIGETVDGFDESEFRSRVGDLVMQHQNASLRDIQVGRVVLEMVGMAASCGVLIPSELALLGKTLLTLDEIGLRLDPEFDPQAAVRRHSGEIMALRMQEEAGLSELFKSLVDSKELVQRLPGRLNAILDNVAENKLKVEVDAIDEAALITAIRKVANRITAGVVLAALIIGAALIMRIDTPFQIFGYPGLAIALFMLAATGGLTLVWNILFKDEALR